MKKIYLLLIILIFYSVASLAQTTTATIPNVTANPNTDVSIPINVNNFNNVGAVNLVINYDPNVLTFQSVPDSLPGFWVLNSLIGQIRIGWFSTTPLNKNNEPLIHLNFNYKGGNSNIEFDIAGNQIADAAANEITTNFNNGSISPFVVVSNSSIGDYVWNDLDSNGIQQSKTIEPPLQNVVVKLFDAVSDPNGTGTPLQTTTTNSVGEYQFSSLTAGTYKVKFELLSGYVFSPKKFDYPTSKDADSDADMTTGLSDVITLTANQQIYGIDAGMHLPAPPPTSLGVIGDYVWNDLDSNGIQQNKTIETPLQNVVVKLFDAASDPNGTGTPMQIDTTNLDGIYQFSNLSAGTYKVKFKLLNGYVFSPKHSDNLISPDGDSDADITTGLSDIITLTTNQQIYDIDAGMYKPTAPPLVSSIGDFVWDDTNKDGMQDNTELGLKDVVVKLLDASNNDTVLKSTITDAQGSYSFGNLSAGSYKVSFTLPTNYNFSPKNASASTNDNNSDVNPTTSKTDAFTLNAGDNLINIDAGMYYNPPPPVYASVGDFVWDDTNKDGIQDNTELGIKDVVVKLLDASNNDTVLKSTITDAQGSYSFGNLSAGSYKVSFTLPTNYNFSPKNANTSTNDNNSDVNPTTGKTDAFTLNAGDNLTNIDAGMYDPPTVVKTPKPTISVSDGVDVSPDSGFTTSYTLLFKNEGDGDLLNVVITDTIPTGYSYISSSGGITSGETSPGSNVVKFQIGSMAKGFVDSVFVTVKVTTVESDYLNIAYINGNDNNNNTYMSYDTDFNLYDQASGGGDAGLESNGDLAQLLFKRQLNISYGWTTPLVAKNSVATINAQHTLNEFIPATGPFSSTPKETTPFDILGISNATSSYAVDYDLKMNNSERRVATIFSTITSAPYIYEHTKAVCDRLARGEIKYIKLVNINGYEFYSVKLRNTMKHTTDYAISFSVYETIGGYKVESKWTTDKYISPTGATNIYNFQVWSSSINGTVELVKNILSKFASISTVTYMNVNQILPDFYISSSYYSHDGTIHLSIVNQGSSNQMSFDLKYRINQGETQVNETQNITLQNGMNEVVLTPGILSDANVTINSTSGFSDEVFVSGGSYTDIVGPNSTVSNFTIPNLPQQNASDYPSGALLLSGGASITGNLADWVTVFRGFNAGGDENDLSKYSTLRFDAKGTGTLTIIFDMANTQNFNYFSYNITLTANQSTYLIDFNQLTEIFGGQGKFDPKLVKNFGFMITKTSNPNLTNFNFDVSNIAFTNNIVTGIDDNTIAPKKFELSQNYPNPFNPSTNIEFTVAKIQNISLIVYNILGQQVKVLVNKELNVGKHVFNFDASGLASGIYIYRLSGSSVNLTKKMILMK